MYKHRSHDLYFHDDVELGRILGSRIATRETIHEWPLSSVQKVTTSDGRKLIYKSQVGTGEADFYTRARSDLLPSAETVFRSDSHSCLLIEFIDAPLIQDLNLSRAEIMKAAREVVAQVAALSGDFAHIATDLTSESKWLDFVESTLRDLQELHRSGVLHLVTDETIETLARCARAPCILEAVTRDPGLVHGDLGCDNVFVCPDGYKVIDWHPLLGPTALNWPPSFVKESGVDVRGIVPKETAVISRFLGAAWSVQCKKRWIPDGQSYDRRIVEDAAAMCDLLR